MENEIFADLWNMTEFERVIVEPVPTETVKRGRASLFDPDKPDTSPGSNTTHKSGIGQVKYLRGRPLKYKNGENLPGMVFNSDETTRNIREVSGLGHSNEVIERSFRKCVYRKESVKNAEGIEKVSAPPMPDIGFRPSPHPSPSKKMFANNGIPSDNNSFKYDKSFPPLK